MINRRLIDEKKNTGYINKIIIFFVLCVILLFFVFLSVSGWYTQTE